MSDIESPDMLKAVSDIVVAFLAQHQVAAADLPDLILSVRTALVQGLERGASPGRTHAPPVRAEAEPAWTTTSFRFGSRPAIDPADTVFDDYLICLEDGRRYRSLRRHLMAKYGLTPDQYRERWGLPPDYPMVAPSFARERSAVAKRSGLGRTRLLAQG
jgi:predicted transcriptional regulator